jgi:polyphosphate kinase
LFLIVNPQLKREAINILMLNMMDNQNSYVMREDGAYVRQQPAPGEPVVNVHKDFFRRDEALLATATPEGLLALLDVQAQRRLDVAATLEAQTQAAALAVMQEMEATTADSFGEGEPEDACEDDATPVGHVDEEVTEEVKQA